MNSPSPWHQRFATQCKMLYVGLLLKLLPTLLNWGKRVSLRIKSEFEYLDDAYTFQLKVGGTGLTCACQLNKEKLKFYRVPLRQQAHDVPAGSGLLSQDAQAVTIDYVIDFRSLDYAFACFSGGASLKEALAERAFSTRGPNNTGVALTYMFTALLRGFFFWRRPYKQTEARRA